MRPRGALAVMVAGLLLPAMLAGCLVVPPRRGPRVVAPTPPPPPPRAVLVAPPLPPQENVVVVPPLPPLVIFETEPYYVHEGYHYHYWHNVWYYSRSPKGPWAPLPKDHYPREIKYKGHPPAKDEGKHPKY